MAGLAGATSGLTGSPLGRRVELDQIARFLDGVAGGGSELLLLSGPAGIGTSVWRGSPALDMHPARCGP